MRDAQSAPHGPRLPQSLVMVSVCVCTFQRPADLARLLEALGKQRCGGKFLFGVVVVDNDASESARIVASRVAQTAGYRLQYVVEPTQNIALARNMALRCATGDFIVFVDDDEVPIDTWLFHLMSTYRRYRADGVLGPVLPRYEEPPPSWVVRGRLFDRPSHRTGTYLDWTQTRTGNVLLARHLVRNPDSWFRPQFGIGGEDRDFFRRLIDNGHRFVWCAEAVVHETVPRDRWKRSFLLKRAIQRGMIPQYGPVQIATSFIAVPVYAALLPLLFVFAHHRFMVYMIKVADHVGRLLAFSGLRVFGEKYLVR